MIPKYYFVRLIFQDPELIAPIPEEAGLTPLRSYQKRRLRIQQKIDAFIAALPELAGPDILELIRQREEILRRLDRHASLWLNSRNQPFEKVLQRILRVTPSMIEGYSQALGQLLFHCDVTLLLDRGKTRLRVDRKDYIAKTVLDTAEPTVEKCRELCDKLAVYHCYPQLMTLLLPDGRRFSYDCAAETLWEEAAATEEAAQLYSQMLPLR